MNRDDEILDTLKKILAAQEESLAIAKDFQRRAEETRTATEGLRTVAGTLRNATRFAKVFNIFMAIVVLSVIGYVIFKIQSFPDLPAPPR